MTTEYTVGDLEPPLRWQVSDSGVPMDLSTAETVTVHILRPRSKTTIARPGTITNPLTGSGQMSWQAGDLTESGTHRVEVQVTWPGTRPESFGKAPNGKSASFVVRDQIA